MTVSGPNLIVLAGPNGAGKSTAAPFLLRDHLAVTIYMSLADEWRFYDNSDLEGPRLIARGRSGSEADIIDGKTWRTARPRP